MKIASVLRYKKTVLLLLVVGAFSTLFIDDDLDLESVALLEMAKPEGVNTAWFYLMGFGASPEVDPAYIGRQRYWAIVQANAAMNRTRDEVVVAEIPGSDVLARPVGDVHCALHEKTCVGAILEQQHEIAAELQQHAVLTERYQKFMSLQGYRSLTTVARGLPMPRFQWLIEGTRLVGLQAIHEALNGHHGLAIELLDKNERDIREKLTDADDLIYKLILIAALSENIDRRVVVDHLTDRHPVKISPLTEAEMSFDLPLAREFEFMKTPIDDISNQQKHESIGRAVVAPLSKLLVKPNMTLNTLRLTYEENFSCAHLGQLEFQASANTPLENHTTVSDWVRNSVGTLLMSELPPDFRRYFAKTFDLNAKIHLYNHRSSNPELSIQDLVNTYSNPYYRDVGRAFVSEESGSLCVESPYDNGIKTRCLLIIDSSDKLESHADLTTD